MSYHEMKGKHRAFVFIDVAPGKDRKVLEKLLKYDEVTEVHVITGQYDVLAVLEFELYGREIFASFQETASKFVVEKIRKLKDVRDTNTIIPSFSATRRAE
ncbi:MAG: Lrp/AsnC ligand binding domain-containing protein [Candidatus Bathyarchaeota archaeon]